MVEWFHPAVGAWFEGRFTAGPTRPQAEGWREIAAGRHTLIAAPTGSGKTLAAFLVCIDRIYRAHEAGADPGDGPQAGYVAPLKALAVDNHLNLEGPLAENATAAPQRGLNAPTPPGAAPAWPTPSPPRPACPHA